MASTTISAPGKVLITGGYLVLERTFTGLVIALSARFVVRVEDKQGAVGGSVEVHAPQFEEKTAYYVDRSDSSVTASKSNEFIGIALLPFFWCV